MAQDCFLWLCRTKATVREESDTAREVAEGSLVTPRGQGARKSQSREAEALMLGTELNGSAWPVPGEDHRKTLLFLFSQ